MVPEDMLQATMATLCCSWAPAHPRALAPYPKVELIERVGRHLRCS